MQPDQRIQIEFGSANTLRLDAKPLACRRMQFTGDAKHAHTGPSIAAFGYAELRGAPRMETRIAGRSPLDGRLKIEPPQERIEHALQIEEVDAGRIGIVPGNWLARTGHHDRQVARLIRQHVVARIEDPPKLEEGDPR